MKHEYYADEKDAAKWTIAFQERGPDRTGVVQVAMMPDCGLPHHSATGYEFKRMPRKTHELVAHFFDAERSAIAEGSTPRDAGRIVRLDPGIVFLNPTHYSWVSRYFYFTLVVEFLNGRSHERSNVVLLDPCTGLSTFKREPEDTHLDPRNISDIWQALRRGDSLMVFQYQLQGTYAGNWQRLTQGAIADALQVHKGNVRNCGLNDAVRFFCITKE